MKLGQPPIWISEVVLRCPDGRKVVQVVGPTSVEAVRKGVKLPPGRCVKESVKLIRRGHSAGLQGVAKKDFSAFASILCRHGASAGLVRDLSNYFAAQNPRFQPLRFAQAVRRC